MRQYNISLPFMSASTNTITEMLTICKECGDVDGPGWPAEELEKCIRITFTLTKEEIESIKEMESDEIWQQQAE